MQSSAATSSSSATSPPSGSGSAAPKRKFSEFNAGSSNGKLVPKEMESAFLKAIFELGLKFASPKVLMRLMLPYEGLNSEHIKSHLQKYRIEWARSENEFLDCYGTTLQTKFHEWYDSMASSRPIYPTYAPTASSQSASSSSSAVITSSSEPAMPSSLSPLPSHVHTNFPSASDQVNEVSFGDGSNDIDAISSSAIAQLASLGTIPPADFEKDESELLELQIREQIKFSIQCWRLENENAAIELEEFQRRLSMVKHSKL